MHTRRQDLFRNEISLLVQGYRSAGNPHRVVGRYAVAADADRATAQSDILPRQSALAVRTKQSKVRYRRLRIELASRISAVNMHKPKWLRKCFIEIAILAVCTQHVLKLPRRRFKMPRVRSPLRQPLRVYDDYIDRLRLR